MTSANALRTEPWLFPSFSFRSCRNKSFSACNSLRNSSKCLTVPTVDRDSRIFTTCVLITFAKAHLHQNVKPRCCRLPQDPYTPPLPLRKRTTYVGTTSKPLDKEARSSPGRPTTATRQTEQQRFTQVNSRTTSPATNIITSTELGAPLWFQQNVSRFTHLYTLHLYKCAHSLTSPDRFFRRWANSNLAEANFFLPEWSSRVNHTDLSRLHAATKKCICLNGTVIRHHKICYLSTRH